MSLATLISELDSAFKAVPAINAGQVVWAHDFESQEDATIKPYTICLDPSRQEVERAFRTRTWIVQCEFRTYKNDSTQSDSVSQAITRAGNREEHKQAIQIFINSSNLIGLEMEDCQQFARLTDNISITHTNARFRYEEAI
jgi:hypothetical protein